MKKVISKDMENALNSVLNYCAGHKSSVLKMHAQDGMIFIDGTESLRKLDLMELALLLDGQYEVEKTVEERLVDQRMEYQLKTVLNRHNEYKLEGFYAALKIIGIKL